MGADNEKRQLLRVSSSPLSKYASAHNSGLLQASSDDGRTHFLKTLLPAFHTVALPRSPLWALCILTLTLAAIIPRFFSRTAFRLVGQATVTTMAATNTSVALPKTEAEWKKALDELPSQPNKLPVFFFGHGSPMLAFPESALAGRSDPVRAKMGPKGPLASFLKDFGPALLSKYKPKAIVVFSAHWETNGERLGTYCTSISSVYHSHHTFLSDGLR